MGSSYLPPPEQNVVNVGDEISASSLAGIQAASPALSQVNPAATEDYVTSALSGISASSSWGAITGQIANQTDLASSLDLKANLSGATFSGKVNFTTVGGAAGLNIGIGGTDVASNTAGDMWIAPSGSVLNYRDGLGASRILAARNLSNTFTAPQIVQTPAGTTNAALRVTQLGTGNALVVEDGSSQNPDSTAFIIDQHGKVGIGVAPDANAALKVDGNGIMFGNGTTQTSAAPIMDQITEFIFSGNVVRSSVSTTIYAGIYDTVIVGFDEGNDIYDTVGGNFAVGTITASNLRFNGNSFSTDSATTDYVASGELLGSGSYYNSNSLATYWWAAYSNGIGSGYIDKDLTSDPSIP
jgi:hypothetical protein